MSNIDSKIMFTKCQINWDEVAKALRNAPFKKLMFTDSRCVVIPCENFTIFIATPLFESPRGIKTAVIYVNYKYTYYYDNYDAEEDPDLYDSCTYHTTRNRHGKIILHPYEYGYDYGYDPLDIITTRCNHVIRTQMMIDKIRKLIKELHNASERIYTCAEHLSGYTKPSGWHGNTTDNMEYHHDEYNDDHGDNFMYDFTNDYDDDYRDYRDYSLTNYDNVGIDWNIVADQLMINKFQLLGDTRVTTFGNYKIEFIIRSRKYIRLQLWIKRGADYIVHKPDFGFRRSDYMFHMKRVMTPITTKHIVAWLKDFIYKAKIY